MADISGTYELGPADGQVLVRTGREGLAARAGHDLVIEITRWSARATVPDAANGGVAAATLTAELDLSALTVRQGTGGAKPLTDRDRRDIQNTARRILGQAAVASFASSRVIPSPSSSGAIAGGAIAGGAAAGGAIEGGAIEGTLTLRGTSRPLRLQVTSPGPGHFRGSATVRQTDFGITPYSGFLGALKLKDEVAVEFDIRLKEIQNGSG